MIGCMRETHDLCYCQAARRSARFMSRLYDRHLAPIGLNVQQMSMLSIIEENPAILIADLADEMVMERTTLVRALKPLQQAGWVLTEPSGSGRSLALSISPSGKKKLREANPLWRQAQREFEKLFGANAASHFRTELKKAAALALVES
jgi:DNA-binding MarR family transcriptional regulator